MYTFQNIPTYILVLPLSMINTKLSCSLKYSKQVQLNNDIYQSVKKQMKLFNS